MVVTAFLFVLSSIEDTSSYCPLTSLHLLKDYSQNWFLNQLRPSSSCGLAIKHWHVCIFVLYGMYFGFHGHLL